MMKRLQGFQPACSLESKWGLIKHNVAKWIGIYQHVLNLNKSETNVADLLKRTHELYLVKSKNNTDFAFEDCWVLVKDQPKWIDGWNHILLALFCLITWAYLYFPLLVLIGFLKTRAQTMHSQAFSCQLNLQCTFYLMKYWAVLNDQNGKGEVEALKWDLPV
jgi:hypothetical protein